MAADGRFPYRSFPPAASERPCRELTLLAIGRASADKAGEGLVAEWLRRGLQILAPRFDSGRGLQCPDFSAVALERQVPVE